LLAREMLRLFFEILASYAANHGVFNAQIQYYAATSRILVVLNDCRRVKC
jgi:hypothetical protein